MICPSHGQRNCEPSVRLVLEKAPQGDTLPLPEGYHFSYPE